MSFRQRHDLTLPYYAPALLRGAAVSACGFAAASGTQPLQPPGRLLSRVSTSPLPTAPIAVALSSPLSLVRVLHPPRPQVDREEPQVPPGSSFICNATLLVNISYGFGQP